MGEALKVAIIGFSVVFLTLVILSISVKIMSAVCKVFEARGKRRKAA